MCMCKIVLSINVIKDSLPVCGFLYIENEYDLS